VLDDPAVPLAPGGAALVTGASSGIGAALAHALGARGLHLIVTARPDETERLEQLAAELAARHGVRCVAVPADLADPGAVDVLAAAATEHGLQPDVLVNAAGVGSAGPFTGATAEDQLTILRVNVDAVVRLTHRFATGMAERRRGAVITIASTAAFQPQPYFAVYAASKAFLLRFGEALWAELRGSGVRVATVVPGAVTVPGERGAEGPVREFLKRRYLTADQVAARALEAVERGRPVVVLRMPVLGRAYHVRTLIGAALPRHVRLGVAERLNRWYFERTG
jgi:hypothetical protein